MNIVILANHDIASNYAVNLLLESLTAHTSKHNVTVFLSAKVGGKSKKAAELEALAEVEQEYFFEQLSTAQTVESSKTQRKALHQRQFVSFDKMVPNLAKSVTFLNEINEPQGLDSLNEVNPDLIISIRFGVILKEAVIAIPRYGVINLHSGLLPDYRGVMATFWAMKNQADSIGTTLHYIDDATIDTGRTIAKSHVDIVPTKSYLWHVLQLYRKGTIDIIKVVNQLANKEPITAQSQTSQGSYYSFPDENELRAFAQLGYTLFDKAEVDRFITRYYQSS